MGLSIQVIRQHADAPDALRDPEQIRPIVVDWRESLSASLQQHLASPLDWEETADAPYFTDKPTWDCYSDLILWAAYDEQRHLSRPTQHIQDWSEDPAYRIVSHSDIDNRYSHLYDLLLWLPSDFGFIFKTSDIAGTELLVGSSMVLLRQLAELNNRTWQADVATLHQWRRDGADSGCPLEVGARFAFAVFYELTMEAVKHRLPMRLDW